MTEAMRAHLRLLERLPVRTVISRAPAYNPKMGGRSKVDTQRLHEKILALVKRGASRSEIASKLGVSLPTVGKHLNGKIRCV